VRDTPETETGSPDGQQNSPLTIGLFVSSAEDKYENAILHGVFDIVHQAGANLICFTSGGIRSYHGFEAQGNVLYDLVNAENVDGLIISGTLSHSIGLEEMARFCQRYHPIPAVSIALALKGVPGLLVNGIQGVRDVLVHLIKAHNYRRLAFIRGPKGQAEAEERYRAYLDTLTEYDLTFDPDLVASGDYTYASGIAAMRQLLNRPDTHFDAVAAANDSMALGAIKVLQAHGLRVPADVAVTGFDDAEEGRYITPALTTARQSAYEQGRQAAKALLALLAGNKIPERVFAPAPLVIRQSCGCSSYAMEQFSATPMMDDHTSEATLAAQREMVCAEMVQAAQHFPGDLAFEWAYQLFDAFCADLSGELPDAFLPALDDILRRGNVVGGDAATWHRVLSALRRYALPYLTNEQTLFQAENLLQQALALIGETAERIQAYLRVQVERRSAILREIGEAMVSAFDLTGLLDAIAWELPRIGIKACYLSLYENPGVPAGWSRLILAYDEKGRIELPPEGKRFPSYQLTPDGILQRKRGYGIVVEALYSKEEQLGFVLLEVDPPKTSVCGVLRRLLSSALQGALLEKQRKQAEEELRQYRDQLEELVEARTLELRKINAQLEQEVTERLRAEAALKEYSERLEEMVEERTRELETAQERLIRQEKLAVLGQMAGGVGHELRNPLGVISNAVYFLQMVLTEADETVTEYLGIIASRVQEAEKIISDLLNLSRNRRADKTEVAIRQLLEGVLARHPVPKGVTVAVEIPPNLPSIFVDAQQIGQVLTNLVTNAYHAMLDGGALTFSAQAEQGQMHLSITDTGCGISPETMEKIFEPLFTTRSKGIGLGLAISKNLVNVNGGSIEVESIAGQGSTFTLTLPTGEASL